MSKTLNLNELQGNILRGYRADLTHVRYLLLEVVDLSDARRFLAASIEGVTPGVPKLTTAAHWADKKPHMCFNIGVTYEGLKALGTPASSLATCPLQQRLGALSLPEGRRLVLNDWYLDDGILAGPAALVAEAAVCAEGEGEEGLTRQHIAAARAALSKEG